MYINAANIGVRSLVGVTALCALLFVGAAGAGEFNVKVAIHVSTQGIDLKQPAGAEELYRRLQHAAYVACTYGNRIDLKPADSYGTCSEEALGESVRSVNSPLLTEVYLQTHTASQAAVYGIHVPRQVAAN